jgi:hypothetical protein
MNRAFQVGISLLKQIIDFQLPVVLLKILFREFLFFDIRLRPTIRNCCHAVILVVLGW